jgi:iron complex transport system ATP-binding protein
VAVVGLNGSGKSTFIKTLCKKQPFHGNIFLEGFDISALTSKKLSRHLAVLEQKNSISFSIPVIELVVMGKFRKQSFFNSYAENDYLEAEQALDHLGILKYRNSDFNELSGGEQQLVWMAQLILQDSSVWLLDEPTQQLDLFNKKKLFRLFQELVENKRKTIFCVTHDLSYLNDFHGHYYINFSEKTPELKTITKETPDYLIRYLEEKEAEGF